MSNEMKAATAALHLRPKPLVSAEVTARAIQQQERVDADLPDRLTRDYAVVRSFIDGMPVITLTPRDAAPVGELLYLHGGAYVLPVLEPHWQIIDRLGADAPLRITVPLYPLAPEHTGDEAYPKLHGVYDDIASSDLPLVIAGDSAGAAIAMACTIRARDEHQTAPEAVLLFSPWVDATMTNPDIPALERHDPTLASAGLIWCAEQWAGSRATTDPWISPLNDSLENLPQIAVFQGGVDVFAPDARRFVSKALTAGTKAELHFFEDAFHVFVGAPQLPEAKEALSCASAIISSVTAR